MYAFKIGFILFLTLCRGHDNTSRLAYGSKSQHTFSVKDQVVNLFWFVGHMASIVTIQLLKAVFVAWK